MSPAPRPHALRGARHGSRRVRYGAPVAADQNGVEAMAELPDVERMKGVGLTPTYQETPGAHMWSVWRRYLCEFAPPLFR
jgi:hypothetical protein